MTHSHCVWPGWPCQHAQSPRAALQVPALSLPAAQQGYTDTGARWASEMGGWNARQYCSGAAGAAMGHCCDVLGS